MELVVSGTYEIVSQEGNKYVLHVTGEESDKYFVTVLEHAGEKADYSGHIMKTGMLLAKGTITRLDKPLEELKQGYKKSRRRTSDEIEVDNLIEHVQRNFRLNQLWEQINEALDNGEVDTFVKLSKEYAKLKRKVTA